MMAESNDPQVLVFDFDGVLLESVDVKDEAYRDLFPDTSAEQRQAVYDFHRATPGIHRRTKVERILTEVLGRTADESIVEVALERFREIAWERLMECPEVQGVRAFLEAKDHLPKYVVSATPNEELKEIASARGFTRYFCEILGSPTGKAELLARIVDKEHADPCTVTMYGDKLSDMQAAKEVGVNFVGRKIKKNQTHFPADVSVLENFIGEIPH